MAGSTPMGQPYIPRPGQYRAQSMATAAIRTQGMGVVRSTVRTRRRAHRTGRVVLRRPSPFGC